MKHVVIAGGGFAGVRLARKLSSNNQISVTLINSDPDFRYCPALYRAATGHKIGTARLPLEWMLLATNTTLIIDTVKSLNTETKTLTTEKKRDIKYDYIVFALGSVTTYFDIEGLHKHAYGIKSIDEVTKLRSHIHNQIAEHHDKTSNYVIVGGGPTGVEVAGALGTYVKSIMRSHHSSQTAVKIWLVDSAPRILPNMSNKSSRVARRKLRQIGVKIQTDTLVKAESIHCLQTSNGKIPTDTVIWTAGTTTNPFFNKNKQVFTIAKNSKVSVNEHLEVSNSIYVIGDNADTKYSGLAQTAIKHADFVAKDIKAKLNNSSRPHHYESKPIQIVPVGKKRAILQYGSFTLSGRLIAPIRSLADYIGYSDVLGWLRALTIWTNADQNEFDCPICKKS
ncbi:FAD-dependent oxidoreductase [Candidatus Saccharibacteria bacterium]|nr:FAD-dependent oxidoreductase [Candidatus Saccharibacteria bacterium]